MDNIHNEEKDFNQITEIDVKNKEEPIIFFEPNWVPLRRMKMTSDGILVPDDSLYVPSNLLDDIEKGNIDSEKYTREELRRMSLNRQQNQATMEKYVGKKYENKEKKSKFEEAKKSKASLERSDILEIDGKERLELSEQLEEQDYNIDSLNSRKR